MMNKNDKLKDCKFYHGEPSCPDDVDYIMWRGEEMYVNDSNPESIKETLQFYFDARISDVTVGKAIGPLQVAYIFSMYYHAGGGMYSLEQTVVSFREWFTAHW